MGRVIRRDYANGAYSTQAFDFAGNLTEIVNAGPGGADPRTLDYSYDQTNHRTRLEESDEALTTWDYDGACQLTHERRTQSGTLVYDLSYAYDPAGNRTLQTAYDGAGSSLTTLTYSDANRLLTEISPAGTTTHSYDQAGNQTKVEGPQGTTWYEYDAAGRMTACETAAGRTAMVYNAIGQRVGKESHDGQATGFLFAGTDLVHQTDGIGGDIDKTYTTTCDDEYGDVLSEGDDEAELYHQYDAQANGAMLSDDDGDPTRYKYLAFGLSISATAGWADLTAQGWAGMSVDDWGAFPVNGQSAMGAGGQKQYYLDPETGLYLLGMGGNGHTAGGRYYDPATGRFLSEDPIRFASGDPNFFRYVGNDPVNKLDPSGMDPRKPEDINVAPNSPSTFSSVDLSPSLNVPPEVSFDDILHPHVYPTREGPRPTPSTPYYDAYAGAGLKVPQKAALSMQASVIATKLLNAGYVVEASRYRQYAMNWDAEIRRTMELNATITGADPYDLKIAKLTGYIEGNKESIKALPGNTWSVIKNSPRAAKDGLTAAVKFVVIDGGNKVGLVSDETVRKESDVARYAANEMVNDRTPFVSDAKDFKDKLASGDVDTLQKTGVSLILGGATSDLFGRPVTDAPLGKVSAVTRTETSAGSAIAVDAAKTLESFTPIENGFAKPPFAKDFAGSIVAGDAGAVALKAGASATAQLPEAAIAAEIAEIGPATQLTRELHEQAFARIETARRRGGFATVKEGGTMAGTEVEGSASYGVNSKQQWKGFGEKTNPKLKGGDGTLDFRRYLFEELKNEPEFVKLPNVGRAEALSHAELQSLFRAAQKNSWKLPSKLVMHVDRFTCDSCTELFSAILRRMKVDELRIYYRTQEGIKEVFITQNGLQSRSLVIKF